MKYLYTSLMSRSGQVALVTAIGAILGGSNAQAETALKMDSLIIAEVSNRTWTADEYPYSGYTAGRFFLDGSIGLPGDYNLVGQMLLRSIVAGEFDILQPLETGKRVADLIGYKNAQSLCSRAPIRYWSGAEEMSTLDVQKRRKMGSSDITPYFPGRPRPIDYEFQFRGSLQPYAAATSNLALYDAGATDGGSRLLLFSGEEYKPVGDEGSGSLLEGTVAGFEIPSCRFIGTLDYHTHCFSPGNNPSGRIDSRHVAQVIQLHGRPFVIAIWHSVCEGVEDLPSTQRLLLWDVASGDRLPTVYGFSSSAPDQ